MNIMEEKEAKEEEILKIDANQLIEAARKYLDPDDSWYFCPAES